MNIQNFALITFLKLTSKNIIQIILEKTLNMALENKIFEKIYCSIKEFQLRINFISKLVCKTGRQKIAILIRMQFLNDIIKSSHGFKAAQKFHKFRVFIKTIKL